MEAGDGPERITIKDLKPTKGLAGSSDTSDHGGAICNAGELTVISCEIIGNTAKTSSGGGVFVKAGGKCTITGTSSRKSIIGKNVSPKGAGIQIEGECTIGEYTVIGGFAENANKGNARVTPSINSEKNTPAKNDVYLGSGTTIKLEGTLNPAGGAAARITPQVYGTDKYVLSGDLELGTPANYTKFTVTPQTLSSSTQEWQINSSGYLKKKE